MTNTDEPVVVEQTFNSTIEKVWDAITDLNEMKQWYFDNIESFRAEVGFETQFKVQSGNRTFTHLWKITEVSPYHRLTYNWKYKEYPGDSFVTFELNEENGQVKLTLSMNVIETFPDEIPEFTRDSCIGGWNYFIRQNLKQYLEAKSKRI